MPSALISPTLTSGLAKFKSWPIYSEIVGNSSYGLEIRESLPQNIRASLNVDAYEFDGSNFWETLQIDRMALFDAFDNTTPFWWDRMWTVPELLAASSEPGSEVAVGALRMS